MKIKFISYILLFFLISTKSFSIDTKAEQAVVADFDTNEILFEKNSHLKTKMRLMLLLSELKK